MKHKVFGHDNIIEVVFNGPIYEGDQKQVFEEITNFITKTEDTGSKPNLLLDLTRAGRISKEAMALTIAAVSNLEIKKTAGFGADPYTLEHINTVQTKAGVKNNKLFRARQEAVDWLSQS